MIPIENQTLVRFCEYTATLINMGILDKCHVSDCLVLSVLTILRICLNNLNETEK